jgi:ATP-dependent Clp protease ATP-binding subunit ClpA
MTSNLGAEASCRLGFDPPDVPNYLRHVRSHFRPEFFNRIDEVVEFRPLDNTTIAQITEKELREISTREGIAAARLKLQWTAKLIDFLAREGFDVRYGARPLQRVLESQIVAPLAHWISMHPDKKGATVCIDVSEDGDVSINPT